MAENTQPNQDQSSEDQALEQKVQTMLGPPPQDANPAQPAKAEPSKSQLPITESAPEAESEYKERVLVIPSSAENKTEETQPSEEKVPLAGETIVPTNPEPQPDEAEISNKKEAAAPSNKIKRFFRKWWRTPKYRNLTIAAGIILLIGAVVLPTTRYFMLNTLGVRSSASITVLDNSTQLPLKNVEVKLGGKSALTDEAGNAKLERIKLGRSQLTIQKRAFSTYNKTVTIGWGSNPLGKHAIVPTGSQYSILVKDWLTGNSLAGASASGGGADANSDLSGKILLTIDSTIAQAEELKVVVKAPGYRDEEITLDLASKADTPANLVIGKRNVFVSNRSGTFNVYSVDVDGKNEKLVLAGTGLENDKMSLTQHPSDNIAALVSTRVNARNRDDFLLSTLTLIDLSDNTTKAIAQSEQIELIGWAGNRLLFVQIAAGASAASPNRFRLVSYDYKTTDKKELAGANSFNDVMLYGNSIYYAASGAYQKGTSPGLVRSNADGTSKQTLLEKEVWNIFRTEYGKLYVATAKDWYEYMLGSTAAPLKLKEKPANPKNRLYVSSPDNKHSLWIDQRDGNDLLIDHNIETNTDSPIVKVSGLAYPVKWLTNDVLVYRVDNDNETADYVLNINGGKPHKITDVYNIGGIDRWYYY